MLLARSPMHVRQFVAVALCCLINMADGYDVLSLALAAPELTREWGVTPAALGIAFSAASFGLVLGALLIAPLADQVGRRPVILAALIIVTLTHCCLAVASSIRASWSAQPGSGSACWSRAPTTVGALHNTISTPATAVLRRP